MLKDASMKPLRDEKKNWTALPACVSLNALGSDGRSDGMAGTVPVNVCASLSTAIVVDTGLSEDGRSGVLK